MRLVARLFAAAAFALGSLGLLFTGALGGCGTDAVGVDACRRIEAARCDAMRACGFTDDEAASCAAFYRDQCLYGIANKNHDPAVSEVDACVAAVNATAACARAGTQAVSGCTGVAASNGAATPCDVLKSVEQLDACSFVAVSDAGTSPTTDAASDTGMLPIPDSGDEPVPDGGTDAGP